MNNEMYYDIHKRILSVTESLVDICALASAICTILVAKGICTEEEIDQTKAAAYETDKMAKVNQLIAERKAEIEQYENEDPVNEFTKLFDKLFGN